MGKSCKDVAQSFVDCLKNSSCVKSGNDIKTCLKQMAIADESNGGGVTNTGTKTSVWSPTLIQTWL